MRPTFIRPLALTATLALALGLTGCGDEERQPTPNNTGGVAQTTQDDLNNAPAWVVNPTEDGKYKLAASGIARSSMGGISQQRPQALTDARTQIAASISTEIRNMVEQFFTQGGEPGAAEAANQVQTNVTRALTQSLVKGSQQKAMWINNGTKDLYVWVVVDPALAAEVGQQAAKLGRAEAERAQVKAELKAQEKLDQLEKAIADKLATDGGKAQATGK